MRALVIALVCSFGVAAADPAVEQARKTVAANPNDPLAYQALAEALVADQRFTEAIAAYETRLQLGPGHAPSQLALADLYLQSAKPKESLLLLFEVVKTNTADDIVMRAGTRAIDLGEMMDMLGALEQVVLPLAKRPAHRRLLVDVYLRFVPRLVERKHSDELARIGKAGLAPLVETLRDDKDLVRQRMAVAVIGYLKNPAAAGSLVKLVRDSEPRARSNMNIVDLQSARELQIDALLAAGRLGVPKPQIADVLPFAEHPEMALREAAIYGLGRIVDARATAALIRALGDRKPSVASLACIGLARSNDAKVRGTLHQQLSSTTTDEHVRAACAWALGWQGDATAVPALVSQLAGRGQAARLASWALGQIGDPKTLGALLGAYVERDRRAADELVFAIARASGASPTPRPDAPDDFPMRIGKYDLDRGIAALPGAIAKPAMPAALLAHATELVAAIQAGLTSPNADVIRDVLGDLDGAPAALSLGPITPASPDLAAMAAIAKAIEPRVLALVSASEPVHRARALSVLAKIDVDATRTDAAIVTALADRVTFVREAAANAVVTTAQRRGRVAPVLMTALVKQLDARSWQDRRTAVIALGGASGDIVHITKLARDPVSFVREAVAGALARRGTAAVEPLLQLSRDDVPQIRATAARSLGTIADPRAQRRRADLARDRDPMVRDAANR